MTIIRTKGLYAGFLAGALVGAFADAFSGAFLGRGPKSEKLFRTGFLTARYVSSGLLNLTLNKC